MSWGGASAGDGTGYASCGAQNGTRTRDLILTKDVLCQLSYLGPRDRTWRSGPLWLTRCLLMEPTTGLEPGTCGLQNRCSTN